MVAAVGLGRLELSGGAGGTRVEALDSGRVFARALGSAAARLVYRRTRARSGFAAAVGAGGSAGVTAGQSWSQWSAGGRLSGILPWATVSAAGRLGDTGGSPSLFDLYTVGGAESAILPPGLDTNRLHSPALPADVQVGKRFEALRTELEASAVPVAVYAEWLRAWDPAAGRPDPVRVAGAEVRLERLIPAEYGRTVSFHVGAGWIVSGEPSIRAVRGYAQLVYRP